MTEIFSEGFTRGGHSEASKGVDIVEDRPCRGERFSKVVGSRMGGKESKISLLFVGVDCGFCCGSFGVASQRIVTMSGYEKEPTTAFRDFRNGLGDRVDFFSVFVSVGPSVGSKPNVRTLVPQPLKRGGANR